MKVKLGLALLTLVCSLQLAFGQAGVGSQGAAYVDYKNSNVDFGTFSINKGVVTGTTTSPLTGHVTIALTAADINALYSAPKLLIAAPGAGKTLAVMRALLYITRTSTSFANGGAAIIQYNSTTHGGGTQACDSTIAATVFTGAAGSTSTIRNGAVISDSSAVVNQGLYLSMATADLDTGTGTATLDVWYAVN